MARVARRSFLRAAALAVAALGLGDALLVARRLVAAPRPTGPFDDAPEKVKAVLRHLFGDRPIQAGHVQLDTPTVAADGRVVPVMIESDLPMTGDHRVTAIHVLVDNNPDIHLAEFRLTPAVGQAFIHTRIKMRMTSPVRAVIETSAGELYGLASDVRVTVNGCG
jgi:sulfur-oxidizing protein SoxY